jgi:polyhydroxyalkanoate synthesis regulator phasin
MDEENLAAEEQRINSEALKREDENLPTESPAVEETPEETEQPEAEVATEAEGQEVETAESPKKGFQSRIKEVVKERDEWKGQAQSLQEKLAELTGSVEPSGPAPSFTPQVEPGSEITPEQYQQDVARAADGLVQLRIKQSEAINRINNEAKDVLRANPVLDPKSENFDRELSETVTEAVEAYVRSNPYTASVSKFVDKLMKPYNRAVTKEVGKVTENIAKQVSETALRPTSVRKPEKAASEKSIAELEEELGVIQA